MIEDHGASPSDTDVTRRIDCGEDGCGECQMCRYLDYLEWAWQASGGVPYVAERNPKLDARLAKKDSAA